MLIKSSTEWVDTRHKMTILLFAQTMLESLDELSHDSYQIPILNIRTFCHDFLNTLNYVDRGIIKEGNMVPLAEEFEFYCNNDYITQKIIGEDICLSLKKTQSGYFGKVHSELTLKEKIKIYKKHIHLLLNKIYSLDNGFIAFIFGELERFLWEENISNDTREKIYYLSRILGVELLANYHRTYVYSTVKKYFFDNKKITDCHRVWRNFKRELLQEKCEYAVTIGTNQELYEVLSNALNGENKKATQREKSTLKLPYVHIYKVEASDPYTACEFMHKFCDDITNVIKCEQHDVTFKLSETVKCKKTTQKNAHYLFERKDFIKKRRNKSEKIAQQAYTLFFNDFKKIPSEFHRVLELHSTAISGSYTTNQLLNLWTILEIIVKVDRDSGEDKISQICNSIISILNVNYLYSKLVYFYNDMKLNDIAVDDVLKFEKQGDTKIEKLLFVLNDTDLGKKLHDLLIKNPLLLTRFEFFSSLFTAPKTSEIYNILAAHSNRLRWHIMRIYRNRNLIIHEGTNMPYLSEIVDNLHFYVDMVIDFMWKKFFDGFSKTEAILTYATSLEGKRFELMGCNFENSGKDRKKHQFKDLDKSILKQIIIDYSFTREMEI